MGRRTGPHERCRPRRRLQRARRRLPGVPRARARPLAQHAGRVRQRPGPVRRPPRADEVGALDATAEDLAGFLDELARGTQGQPPAAPATLARKVACLRSLYRHLRREGMIDRDPAAELRGPRASRRLPNVLTRHEVAQLLAQPQGESPLALRDRAMLELMYACGLRSSEAVTLEVGNLDLEEDLLAARKGLQGAPRARRRRGGRARRGRISRGPAARSSQSGSSRCCSSTHAADR